MLHEIATSDAIDWDAPAAEINAAIEDILKINALKLSPIAGQMKRDPYDQKIYGEAPNWSDSAADVRRKPTGV